jgi:hypothetical protein
MSQFVFLYREASTMQPGSEVAQAEAAPVAAGENCSSGAA